ncbi:MAG: hypothetical protein LBD55_12305 [Treponema sp.]|jgi:hypothetical protein|nr:hypothetical protein [Treponema sp.]
MNSAERRAARRERRDDEREAKRNKTISKYDDFSLVTDPDNLRAAFKKSKRGVSWKESVQRHEMNLLRNISDTRNKLINGENVTHGFVEFNIMERGRPRHIKSVHISERIVQKCLCDQVLVPIISRSLIHDNGASLKRKGLHFAVKRLICHLSKFYRKKGFSNEGYCLSIDFSRFFDNIRHDMLFGMQERIINDEKIRKLIREFIAPFGEGISLGLGSQVSQISAIFYPTRMDHFVKEILGIKYYGRYMDDLYIIHRDKKYLEHCLSEVIKICEPLGITINRKKTKIVKLKDGIKFLKGVYALCENGAIIRRASPESRKRMRRKLNKFKRLLEQGKMSFNDVYIAYQSWRGGYTKRFQSYHTVKRMDKLYDDLFIT